MDLTDEVVWRAWVGMGDADTMDQIDAAEFPDARAAREWVENRLVDAWSRPGMSVFGSVDPGRYTGARWSPDEGPGMDAHLIDGRVTWRCPGSNGQ